MKTAYVWLSIILGLVMATSFWGLIFQDDVNAILQGNTSEAGIHIHPVADLLAGLADLTDMDGASIPEREISHSRIE
jgi:hypothetical protein